MNSNFTNSMRRLDVAKVLHDMGTPIFLLGTGLSALQSKDYKAAEHFMTVAARRLLRLSQHATLGEAADADSTNLYDTAKNVMDEIKAYADNKSKKSINFRLRADVDIMSIASKTDIERVLANLMKNAAESMFNTGGTITITSAKKSAYNTLEISDTGPGLPEVISKNPRCGKSINKKDGLGLGLSIVYETMERMGGHILLSTSHSGTTFRVLFPN
jgi:signal transduction histidine kinase